MRRLIRILWLIVLFGLGLSSPYSHAIQGRLTTTVLADVATPGQNGSEVRTEPPPLTDRVPWLIYFVLTASSVALALILFSLARAKMKSGADQPPPSSAHYNVDSD